MESFLTSSSVINFKKPVINTLLDEIIATLRLEYVLYGPCIIFHSVVQSNHTVSSIDFLYF